MITQTTANLADAAYFALKNKILRGELKSGFPLREEQLSESLGVSRTPLRKALTQLLAEGFLVKGKDRTLRIPYISTSELKDTLKARRLIETAAVAEACNRATEKDITRLEHLIWDEKEALRMHDNLMISSIDMMFHNCIAQASGNKIYSEFVSILGYKISLYLALSNTLGEDIVTALEEHKIIVNAIKLKIASKASAAMNMHLDNVERRMLESIEKTPNTHGQTEETIFPLKRK